MKRTFCTYCMEKLKQYTVFAQVFIRIITIYGEVGGHSLEAESFLLFLLLFNSKSKIKRKGLGGNRVVKANIVGLSNILYSFYNSFQWALLTPKWQGVLGHG